MPDTVVTFNGSTVGLIVRGKSGPAHHPGVMEQHADCILSDGSPMGFFGEPVNGTPKGAASSGVMSGGSSGAGTTAFSSFSPWGSVPGSIIGGLVGRHAK